MPSDFTPIRSSSGSSADSGVNLHRVTICLQVTDLDIQGFFKSTIGANGEGARAESWHAS
jgi:hypothetical protein